MANKSFIEYMNKRIVDISLDETKEGEHLKSILGELEGRFREYMYCAYPKLGNIGLGAFVAMFYQDGFIYPERMRMSESNPIEWGKRKGIVFARDNYTCIYCGKRGAKMEVDHKIPFIRGGSDEIDNLVTSCVRCNRQKKDKTYEEYIEWRKNNGR